MATVRPDPERNAVVPAPELPPLGRAGRRHGNVPDDLSAYSFRLRILADQELVVQLVVVTDVVDRLFRLLEGLERAGERASI